VVVGDDADLPLLVADDRRDRVGLDEQLVLQPLGLVHRRQRGGLVRVPDRDQVRHPVPPCLARRSSDPVGATRFSAHRPIEAGFVAGDLTRTG
jgi:hypothetical protein